MIVAKNNTIMAVRSVHIANPKYAWLPVPSLLTAFLMIPKATKSVAMTTKVMMNVTAETNDARREPMKPEPIARRKAMKARPHAIGWRIMTFVRELAVSPEAVLKPVPSIWAMIDAGWYPMVLGKQ